MVTTGIDIIENSRVKDAIEKNEKFLQRVYTKTEIEFYVNNYQSLAARFAGKEAVIKALDNPEISFSDIEILNYDYGKPYVNIKKLNIEKGKKKDSIENEKDKNKSEKSKIKNIDISLSHIKELSVANCVIEWE